MPDVFISYARVRGTFARQLAAALTAAGREVWIDERNIVPTAQWLEEIRQGIASSNAFLFVISRDSVHSEMCRAELDHAEDRGKRLIPVLSECVPDADVPPALAAIQRIDARPAGDVSASGEGGADERPLDPDIIQRVLEALDVDLAWRKQHTRYLQLALHWAEQGKGRSLLPPEEVAQAIEWLRRADGRGRRVVDLQREYIDASRRAAVWYRRARKPAAAVVLALLLIGASVWLWTRSDAYQIDGVRADAAALLVTEESALDNPQEAWLRTAPAVLPIDSLIDDVASLDTDRRTMALSYMGETLAHLGRVEDVERIVETLALDGGDFLDAVALALARSGHSGAALRAVERIEGPQRCRVLSELVSILVAAGRTGEGREAARRLAACAEQSDATLRPRRLALACRSMRDTGDDDGAARANRSAAAAIENPASQWAALLAVLACDPDATLGPDRAEETIAGAFQIARSRSEAADQSSPYRRAQPYMDLADALIRGERSREAQQALQQALTIAEQTIGPGRAERQNLLLRIVTLARETSAVRVAAGATRLMVADELLAGYVPRDLDRHLRVVLDSGDAAGAADVVLRVLEHARGRVPAQMLPVMAEALEQGDRLSEAQARAGGDDPRMAEGVFGVLAATEMQDTELIALAARVNTESEAPPQPPTNRSRTAPPPAVAALSGLARGGRTLAAREALARLPEKLRHDAMAAVVRGTVEAGDPDDALKELERYGELPPAERDTLLVAIAKAFSERRQSAQAKRLAERAETPKGKTGILAASAEGYMREDNVGEAHASAARALELVSKDEHLLGEYWQVKPLVVLALRTVPANDRAALETLVSRFADAFATASDEYGDEDRSMLQREYAVALARHGDYAEARRVAARCLGPDRLVAYAAIIRERAIELDPTLAQRLPVIEPD